MDTHGVVWLGEPTDLKQDLEKGEKRFLIRRGVREGRRKAKRAQRKQASAENEHTPV